ncbi:MAG: murein biosynthesis integral membrane protein MurJ [Acidobacteria bacterium]|nr:murein biosynthesis integral membrane protein MurJ [Acidobacteriota bacterium]
MKTKPDAEDAGEKQDEERTQPAPTDENASPLDSSGERVDGILGLEVEAVQGNKDTGVAAGEAEVPVGEGVQSVATRDEGAPVKDELTATIARVAPASSAREKPQSIARSAGIVSIAVMGSRVLGLVREQVFANYFGAGFVNDAFQVAFRVPNMLRDLFAEGALSVAFVKTFTDYIEKKNEEEAWKLASMVMNALAIVLSIISILGIILAPYIVSLIAPGFAPEKAALATTLTRIMFPFLLLVALAAVAMGVLNTRGRFGIPASASTLFNVGSIVGGLLCAYWLSGGSWERLKDPDAIPSVQAQRAIIGMAIGTLIGGGLQFLVQVPSLWRVGFRFSPKVSFSHPGVRQVMRLMGPAIIGTAAVQINVFVNTLFASDIPGAPSWLGYSFRLMQFPIGVFGVAIGTATLPAISRYAARNDIPNFRSTLSSSIGLVFLLTIPSACGLIILGKPIIALLYQRGAFTALDTQMVQAAIIGWSIGLVGYSAIKVLSPAFYALDDARTPMIISFVSIAINAAGSYFFKMWLTPYGYGHAGLALSTSSVALVNFLALAFFMRRKIRRLEGRRILSSFLRISLASAALSVTSYFTYAALVARLGEEGFRNHLIETFVPIATGGLVFLVAARLLRVRELNQAVEAIMGRFRHRRAA